MDHKDWGPSIRADATCRRRSPGRKVLPRHRRVVRARTPQRVSCNHRGLPGCLSTRTNARIRMPALDRSRSTRIRRSIHRFQEIALLACPTRKWRSRAACLSPPETVDPHCSNEWTTRIARSETVLGLPWKRMNTPRSTKSWCQEIAGKATSLSPLTRLDVGLITGGLGLRALRTARPTGAVAEALALRSSRNARASATSHLALRGVRT